MDNTICDNANHIYVGMYMERYCTCPLFGELLVLYIYIYIYIYTVYMAYTYFLHVYAAC